jgi:hypothetical protein
MSASCNTWLNICKHYRSIYPKDCFTRLEQNYGLYTNYEKYKYYVFGHYPSSCLYLKTPSCLFFKTQRFGDWILSPSSGKTYSDGPNDKVNPYPRSGDRD